MTKIALLSHAEALALVDKLSQVLIDSVDNGASVGFLPPLSQEEAGVYWRDVCADLMAAGFSLRRLARRSTGGDSPPAAQPQAQRQKAGRKSPKCWSTPAAARIGRALMDALEAEARRLNRTTLVLTPGWATQGSRLCRLRLHPGLGRFA